MNVTLEEVQKDLQSCLQQLNKEETLVVYEAGRPIAEIKSIRSPLDGNQRRPIGLAKGEFTVPDDFNEPLEIVPLQLRPFGL
jgi:antitoxin (DNA-binding transcriptional repressor) of toxin-antitoxin stability system